MSPSDFAFYKGYVDYSQVGQDAGAFSFYIPFHHRKRYRRSILGRMFTPLPVPPPYPQAKVDTERRGELLSQLKKKIGPVTGDLEKLLKAFDAGGQGLVARHDLVAGCASVGVVLSDKDFETLAPVMITNAEGLIDYVAFTAVFRS